MPRLTDCMYLSNALKQGQISDLIAKAKSLVGARGYSQSTLWHYNERFGDFQRNAALFGADRLSEEFIAYYIEEGMQKSPKLTCSSVQRKSLLNLIAKAANTEPVFTYEKEADRIQNKNLRENLTAYEKHLREQEKSDETIGSYIQTAAKFLFHLDETQADDPSKVSATDVRGFITALGCVWSPRSMRIVSSHLKTYMKFAGFPADAVVAARFRTPRKSKPVCAMSNENVEALWNYIAGDDGGDLRAKAIVAMLLATGMGPVDISSLKLDDINWNNDTLSFIQSKTGEGMTIKLFPAMGSAIARYITEQRPKGTGLRFVFLSKRVPYRRITPSVCNSILKTALEEAGAAFVPDQGKSIYFSP